jgi:hypothetical protein
MATAGEVVPESGGLEALGLRPGDRVRFRRRQGGHWHEGKVVGRERDGSIGVRDQRGAARALRATVLQVRTTGPRGAPTWEAVVERAARSEQMKLL